MQKVGVLGSAVVGQTLAKGFQAHGYDVRIGSRTPSKLGDFSRETGIASGTFADVAKWGEILVLAVRGENAEEALRLAGADHLAGKMVIDTTNPLANEAPTDGVLKLFTSANTSLMEQLQAAFPAARFVKAFSCVGNARMVNPTFKRGRPAMFYCGNDEDAKASVSAILERFGWEPADMGTAAGARAIEPLVQLWCIPGFRQNRWSHAFAVLWD